MNRERWSKIMLEKKENFAVYKEDCWKYMAEVEAFVEEHLPKEVKKAAPPPKPAPKPAPKPIKQVVKDHRPIRRVMPKPKKKKKR